MARRKKVAPKERPVTWEVRDYFEVNGRTVYSGDEISIMDHSRGGRRRRFRFLEHVYNEANGASWVTCTDVDSKSGKSASTRSFEPERVTTVHRDRRLDPRVKR